MGLLSNLLGTLSGNNNLKVSEQLLFDKVIGFKSIVPGCGASTVLQNVAIALSETTKFNICVLDTSFLYPVQYPLLATSEIKGKDPDILDFSGDLSKIVRNTSYPNIYVAQLENRTVVDMLSGKDTESNITKLIANLKSYFDIILVDLSYEFTNTCVYSAIKCNKIILVADTSLKCLYYIKKCINTMVTLGIPLAKCNKVILNKELQDVVLGVNTAVEEAGLEVIASIPLSMDIAVYCASGKKIYGALSKEKGISAFNIAVDTILSNIIEKSPLNSEYLDISKELSRMEELQKQRTNDNDDVIVEEVVGEFSMEEIEDGFGEEIIDAPLEEMLDISEEGVGEDK